MGKPNRDGQPRRPQGLWSIGPKVHCAYKAPQSVQPFGHKIIVWQCIAYIVLMCR